MTLCCSSFSLSLSLSLTKSSKYHRTLAVIKTVMPIMSLITNQVNHAIGLTLWQMRLRLNKQLSFNEAENIRSRSLDYCFPSSFLAGNIISTGTLHNIMYSIQCLTFYKYTIDEDCFKTAITFIAFLLSYSDRQLTYEKVAMLLPVTEHTENVGRLQIVRITTRLLLWNLNLLKVHDFSIT